MNDLVARHKGVGLIPIIQGLNVDPRAPGLVPHELRHYLTDKILPSAWYAESDYEVLIQVLAGTISRKQAGGDVWAFFGRTGAQRDIAGKQDTLPARSRTEISGTYRNLLPADSDVAGVFQRVGKIWRLYHDTGYVKFARHPRSDCTVIVQLHDFTFPCRGLLDLQTAYLTEFARIAGIAMEGELTRMGTAGAGLTEWHYRVEQRPEYLPSLGTIPVAHERKSSPVVWAAQ